MLQNKALNVLLSCCFLWGLNSCGYRFAASREASMGFDKLCIRLFENRTAETGIEVMLTDNLKNEFIRSRSGVLSQTEDEATVLSGSITEFRTWTVARRGTLTSLERRILISVDVVLKDAHGEPVRTAAGVSASGTYSVVSGDKEASEANKRRTVHLLTEQIAESVFHRITEDF